MKPQYFCTFVAAGLLVGCSSQGIIYKPVPPVTQQKAPIMDVAPKETAAKMSARALHLKKRIAIARFGDVGWVDDVPFKRDDDVVAKAGGTEHLTEMLISELHNTGRFDIVERKNIEDVLKELKFGETRWVDKSNAAKAGDVLGAQCIVMASAGKDDAGNTAAFIRMVDVSTSRITAAVAGIGADAPQAIGAAVAELIKKTEPTPWVARIAKITEAGNKKELVIDSGKDLGVEPGDVFAVFSLGEPIKSPNSDKVIGYRENGAGLIRVLEVKEQFSVAEPVQLTGDVKVGDLIRPAIDQ